MVTDKTVRLGIYLIAAAFALNSCEGILKTQRGMLITYVCLDVYEYDHRGAIECIADGYLSNSGKYTEYCSTHSVVLAMRVLAVYLVFYPFRDT